MSKDVISRWASNGSHYKKCTHFWNAIQKYGWNKFEHVILINNIPKEIASIIERELINKYNTRNDNFGYNIAEGGHDGIVTKGKNHWHSKPVYQYDLKGNFIKEWENAQRASETLDIAVSDIHSACRENSNVKRAGKYMWSYKKVEYMEPYTRLGFSFEPILQLDRDFNIVKRYNCISFVDDTIYTKERITYCCTRKNLTHKNYYWCYEKDYNPEEFKTYIYSKLKNMGNSKIIYQCDLNGNILKEYENSRLVAENTIFKRSTILAWCKHPNHGITSGYIWLFKMDYDTIGIQNIMKELEHKINK